MKKVCILGMGYIGLPTAALISKSGYQVLGVDKKEEIITNLRNGRTHIDEPGLKEIILSSHEKGLIEADLKPSESDIYIITVPTPCDEQKKPDTTFVESVVSEITGLIKKGDLILLESTCPVGTTEKCFELILSQRKDLFYNGKPIFHMAYCPERVIPGNMIYELKNNDRIIGGIDTLSSEKAKKFYNSFVDGECFITNSKTAELIKLSENSYRDINIAFANELSLISKKLDVNVFELIDLANKHPRVNILSPGPGVGGHCIAVDPWFIVDSAPDISKLIKTARNINDSKPSEVVQNILDITTEYQISSILILGATFKPNVEDLRESPSIEIIKKLSDKNFEKIFVAEPNIQNLPSDLNSKVSLISLEEGMKKCDLVISLVGHDEFKSISKEDLKDKILVDINGFFQS